LSTKYKKKADQRKEKKSGVEDLRQLTQDEFSGGMAEDCALTRAQPPAPSDTFDADFGAVDFFGCNHAVLCLDQRGRVLFYDCSENGDSESARSGGMIKAGKSPWGHVSYQEEHPAWRPW